MLPPSPAVSTSLEEPRWPHNVGEARTRVLFGDSTIYSCPSQHRFSADHTQHQLESVCNDIGADGTYVPDPSVDAVGECVKDKECTLDADFDALIAGNPDLRAQRTNIECESI